MKKSPILGLFVCYIVVSGLSAAPSTLVASE